MDYNIKIDFAIIKFHDMNKITNLNDLSDKQLINLKNIQDLLILFKGNKLNSKIVNYFNSSLFIYKMNKKYINEDINKQYLLNFNKKINTSKIKSGNKIIVSLEEIEKNKTYLVDICIKSSVLNSLDKNVQKLETNLICNINQIYKIGVIENKTTTNFIEEEWNIYNFIFKIIQYIFNFFVYLFGFNNNGKIITKTEFFLQINPCTLRDSNSQPTA